MTATSSSAAFRSRRCRATGSKAMQPLARRRTRSPTSCASPLCPLQLDQREGDGQTAFGEPYSADEDYDNVDWKLAWKWTWARRRWRTRRSRRVTSRARTTRSGDARAVEPGAVGDDDGLDDRHQEPIPRRPPAGERRSLLLRLRRPAGAVVQPEHGTAHDLQRPADDDLGNQLDVLFCRLATTG